MSGLPLTTQERETLLYALLVGVNCAASDVELLTAQRKEKEAQEIAKLAMRCRHLLERVKAYEVTQ